MKIFVYTFWLVIIVTLISCDDIEEKFPKSTFDAPFPKKNKNLANILGYELKIKQGKDTVTLQIIADKNYNLITNSKTGDTIFFGKISKFRGLYYFTQQLNDSSYWIYAVKIRDSLLYGLNTALRQTSLVDREIKKDNYRNLIKNINTEKNIIRLHPDKKELRKIFAAILDSILPDTIIQFKENYVPLTDTEMIITPIDPDEFEFLSKAYPNPTDGIVNIELQQTDEITFQLTDSQGTILFQGKFIAKENKIDLTNQPEGVYSLILINSTGDKREIVKIIKGK